MESSADLPVPAVSAQPASSGELVVQTGRLTGVSRPLVSPVTLIGKEEGCDFRLNVEGVSPIHCILVPGETGWLLRALQTTDSTLVNGEQVATTTLHDGDLLSVGPVRFQVKLPPKPQAEQDEREQTALRIQVAAVAAQQAALTEEETKLQQRRQALEQQEGQLAAHFDDKRRRLLEVRDQAKEARAALQEERAAFEVQAAETTRQLACARAEVADTQKQVQAERQRLLTLRQRMKWRWHRHWAAERAAIRQQQEALAKARAELDKERERLTEEQAALIQQRLRLNGETELARRHLDGEWDDLRQEQTRLGDQANAMATQEAHLVEARDQLLEQQRHWAKNRLRLQQEAEGLEKRIGHLRQKLPLQGPVPDHGEGSTGSGLVPPIAGRDPDSSVTGQRSEEDPALQQRLAALETLANEVADQRMHLAEQVERFVIARERWQQERDTALAELEPLARRLQEREHAAEGTEADIRHRQEELARLQRYLDTRQARLTVQTVAFETERERWTAASQTRWDLAERQLTTVARFRQRCHQRFRLHVDRLRADIATWAELQQDCLNQREEWLRRLAELDQQKKQPASQGLAKERQAIEQAITRLEERFTQLKEQAELAASQEADGFSQKLARDHEQVQVECDDIKERQERQALQTHRDALERQVQELTAEVERLANLLWEDAPATTLPLGQAA